MDLKQTNEFIFNYILTLIGPNNHQIEIREKKYSEITELIKRAFSNKQIFENVSKFSHNQAYEDILSNLDVEVFCFGSFPIKLFLPDSDLDITVLFLEKNSKKPFTEYSNDMLY